MKGLQLEYTALTNMCCLVGKDTHCCLPAPPAPTIAILPCHNSIPTLCIHLLPHHWHTHTPTQRLLPIQIQDPSDVRSMRTHHHLDPA